MVPPPPVGALLLWELLQPVKSNPNTRANMPTGNKPRIRRFNMCRYISIPMTAAISSHWSRWICWLPTEGVPLIVREVVVTTSDPVEFAAADDAPHVAPVGNPVQLSV